MEPVVENHSSRAAYQSHWPPPPGARGESVYFARVRLVSYLTPGFPVSLFETLADVAGADVHFVDHTSGPGPDDDPFLDRTADLGWLCASSYIDLISRDREPSVRLVGVAWVPDDPDAEGRPVYFSDLVTRADSPIGSLDDIGGRRVGCNDPVSLSGHYALRLALDELGHDPDSFAELVFTGGHNRSLDLLLGGELDAAVIDSAVRTRRAGTDPDVAGLRIAQRLGPWPVQPLVARSTLPTEVTDAVQQRLLAASMLPAVQHELAAAGLSHLVAVDSSDYDSLRSALARLG